MNKKITVIVALLLSLQLTGCGVSEFVIDFERLAGPTISNSIDESIKSVSLQSQRITVETLESLQNKIETLFQTVTTNDFYLKHYLEPAELFASFKDLFSDTAFSAISKAHPLYQAIVSIMSEEFRFYDSASILSILESTDNLLLEVEVVSVNDELEYIVERLAFTLDFNFKITNVEQISSEFTQDYPTRPLISDPALLASHDSFKSAMEELLGHLENTSLRNSIIENHSEELELELQSLISATQLELPSNEALRNLFMLGSESFTLASVHSILISDAEATAITDYTVLFPSQTGALYFKFSFDRISNKIIQVQSTLT